MNNQPIKLILNNQPIFPYSASQICLKVHGLEGTKEDKKSVIYNNSFESFKVFLQKARDYIRNYPEQTKLAIINAWDEQVAVLNRIWDGDMDTCLLYKKTKRNNPQKKIVVLLTEIFKNDS